MGTPTGTATNRDVYQTGPTVLRAGTTWIDYEFHYKINDLGVDNGVVEIWLNGIQVMNLTDWRFRDATYPRGFLGRDWAAVYGGGGPALKTRDDYIEVDSIYQSVKDPVD